MGARDDKRIMCQNNTYHVPRSILERRAFVESHVDVSSTKILEIGAMDTPLYRPHEADIRFLDWYSTSELESFLEGNPRRKADQVVDVDFAIKKKRFSTDVPEKFDLVIASHVIEHIPDVVAWIQEIENVLTPSGRVFLAVPDRRYTFDIVRQETDAVDLIRCYDEDLEIASYYQILRDLYYYRPVRGEDAWSDPSQLDGKVKEKRFPLSVAMEKARRLAESYNSVHCHVFSFPSFSPLWADLLEAEMFKLRLMEIADVPERANEFHVLFGKD